MYILFLKAWHAMKNEHRDPIALPFSIKCKTHIYLPGICRTVFLLWLSFMATTTSYQMAGSKPAGDQRNCLFKNHCTLGKARSVVTGRGTAHESKECIEERSSLRSISVSSPCHFWHAAESSLPPSSQRNASLCPWFL